MKIREYSGPLTVLAAGVLGFSLICIVSAAALANPRTSAQSDIGAQDIVDSAFSNPISTAAAMTAVEIYEYIPTATPSSSATTAPSTTAITSPTPTRVFVTWTPIPPTRTRMVRVTATASRVPSQTPTHVPPPSPTNTRVPTSTFTPRPTDPPPTLTDTPEPPPTHTNTPEVPTSTDTPDVPTETPLAGAIVP